MQDIHKFLFSRFMKLIVQDVFGYSPLLSFALFRSLALFLRLADRQCLRPQLQLDPIPPGPSMAPKPWKPYSNKP